MTQFSLALPGGRPSALAGDPDGSVWFVDPTTATIAHTDAAGETTRYPLAPGSRPGAIALGPGGNVWFTDSGTPTAGGDAEPAIGRLTPSGAVSRFRLPTQEANPMGAPGMGSFPAAIVAGPDGAMWFTEAGADQIGQITAEGVIAEFPLPGRERAHASPNAIVTGPDGAMWFTQPLRESLGRIDVKTHAISELPFPPPRGGLVRANSLASGPGATLWFDDTRDQAIGRMALDGQVELLPLPAGDYLPTAVTAGADGAVWFVDMAGRRVVRMTATGSVTASPAIDDLDFAGATQMAASSDGAVWFAVPAGNRLGRIACGT
jgi:virginiamycin B lyase